MKNKEGLMSGRVWVGRGGGGSAERKLPSDQNNNDLIIT